MMRMHETGAAADMATRPQGKDRTVLSWAKNERMTRTGQAHSSRRAIASRVD